ncbi:MAG: orotidine 5'-phosphate decarboxylase, partial [Thermoproteota archaeon]
GTDYLIVGRTILNAKNPVTVLKELQLQSFGK